jgi:hypothetical protein
LQQAQNVSLNQLIFSQLNKSAADCCQSPNTPITGKISVPDLNWEIGLVTD